jgi:uncharacterized 2Fe-2S/4Fe-4S cluster protein (DUF4445 family)
LNLSEKFAIAFDLGTTSIAAALLNPLTGERLAMTGGLNPQREFGLDVVSRLEAALNSEGALLRMKVAVNGALEKMALGLLADAGANVRDLKIVAVAGNPAMEHFLLGLPIRSLSFPPYRPIFTAGQMMNSAELGWDSAVTAYIFPLPGGFVGGDLVAFLHGVDVTGPRSLVPGPRLFLDLGTNGEIALVTGDKIFATSAAAGPAFEGGNLACGMAALAGAISAVRIDGETLRFTTIGGGPPVGICGSGVLETIGELLRNGLLDQTGRLRLPAEISSNLANRVSEIDSEAAFVIYRDAQRVIRLGQKDIRQVQLAKAAIRAGIEVLCERSDIPAEAVQEVVLTGSFGAILDPGALKNVGILPEKMVNVCSFIREGALSGVARSICSPGGIEEIDRLAKRIRVFPLSGTPAFEKHFLEQMNFPHLNTAG